MSVDTHSVDALPVPPDTSDPVWLTVDLTLGEQHAVLVASPQLFYEMAQAGIKSMLVGEEKPDCPPGEKRLKQLVRTGIKGLFLTFGTSILDMLFQSKEHPHPQKGDDLIEWYSNIFAQIILTKCTDGVLILKGKEAQFGQTSRPIIIDEIRTLPTSDHSL